MHSFTAPAWDVDRPANELYENFSKGHKCSRKNKKAKKNPSTVFVAKNVRNRHSKLENNAGKVRKFHQPRKKKRTKKSNALIGNSGIQPTLKKNELLTSIKGGKKKIVDKVKANRNRKRGKKHNVPDMRLKTCDEKYATKDVKFGRKRKSSCKDRKSSQVFEPNTITSLNLNESYRKHGYKRTDKTNYKAKAQVVRTFNTSKESNKRSKPKFSSVTELSSATEGNKNKVIPVSGKIKKEFDKNESFKTPVNKRKRKLLQMESSKKGNEPFQKKMKVHENDHSINIRSEPRNSKDELKHSPTKARFHISNRRKTEQETFLNKKRNKDTDHKHVKLLRKGVTPNTNFISNKSKQEIQMHNRPVPSKKKKDVEQSSLSLRERMMDQLKSSRFRYINEQFYLSHSKDAKYFFENDPDSFYKYHEGFKQQVELWPLNPVVKIIKAIKRKSSDLVIADFGCGDATLAKSVPNRVHSFDLVALSEEVTVCDIANTPLENGSIDVGVFCLSLMGTNLSSYLIEANRVLKDGGALKIAEVASRFDDVDMFIKNLKKYGFSIVKKDFSHNLFYFMNFTKTSGIKKIKDLVHLNLKPCWYKKR